MTQDEMAEPIKAGDKLVRTLTNTVTGIARRDVMIVERLTRTGRVIVGPYELDADLSPRGLPSGLVRVERCNPELEAEVQRENAERDEWRSLQMRIDEVRWCEVPLEKLRQVAAIVIDDTQITGETR
jgi:hypothetical protein